MSSILHYLKPSLVALCLAGTMIVTRAADVPPAAPEPAPATMTADATAPAPVSATAAVDLQTLIDTEIEHVEDLLSLHQPEIIGPHLELLRRFAPERQALWTYYDGQVLLQEEHPVELVVLYSACKREDYSDALWSSLQRSLFLAYCNLGEFEKARAIAEVAATNPALYPWSLDSDLELAKAMYRQALNLSAVSDRQALRLRAVGLLEAYAERFPAPDRRPWVAFAEAELYYERLQAALDRFHAEQVPVTPAPETAPASPPGPAPQPVPLPKSLRVFVYQVRALFLQIQSRYPESAEGFRALRRVVSLERELQADADARQAMTGRDTALPPENETQPDTAPPLDVTP